MTNPTPPRRPRARHRRERTLSDRLGRLWRCLDLYRALNTWPTDKGDAR